MKSRMHIPSVTNLFVPKSKRQCVGRRLRVLGLIASLTLLAFATMGLVSIAAADGPGEVANANPDLVELDRIYGTYTSQWNGIVDRELGANPAPLTADRVHSTYTSQWNGMVDRQYGTFAGVWYTDFAAR